MEKIKQKPGRKPSGNRKSNKQKCAEYQQRQRDKLAQLKVFLANEAARCAE